VAPDLVHTDMSVTLAMVHTVMSVRLAMVHSVMFFSGMSLSNKQNLCELCVLSHAGRGLHTGLLW